MNIGAMGIFLLAPALLVPKPAQVRCQALPYIHACTEAPL